MLKYRNTGFARAATMVPAVTPTHLKRATAAEPREADPDTVQGADPVSCHEASPLVHTPAGSGKNGSTHVHALVRESSSADCVPEKTEKPCLIFLQGWRIASKDGHPHIGGGEIA